MGEISTMTGRAWWSTLFAVGCSAFAPAPPGTPEGGEYCFGPKTGLEHCYPTVAERASARAQREQEERALAEERIKAERVKEDAARAEYIRKEQEAADAKTRERDAVLAERNRKRDAEKAAEVAHAAKIHEMALDKAYAVPAISAIICSIQDELKELKADLTREKRVTAVGGVVNLSARDEVANGIVSDTDELAEWRKALKRYGAKELPCKDVAPIVACRNRIESCDEAARGPAEVWAKEQATLWGSDKERPQR